MSHALFFSLFALSLIAAFQGVHTVPSHASLNIGGTADLDGRKFEFGANVEACKAQCGESQHCIQLCAHKYFLNEVKAPQPQTACFEMVPKPCPQVAPKEKRTCRKVPKVAAAGAVAGSAAGATGQKPAPQQQSSVAGAAAGSLAVDSAASACEETRQPEAVTPPPCAPAAPKCRQVCNTVCDDAATGVGAAAASAKGEGAAATGANANATASTNKTSSAVSSVARSSFVPFAFAAAYMLL